MKEKSVQCTVCIKSIHTWCSGVSGDLSLLANGLRCKRCVGTLQEVDLAMDLVVDGETYGCVEILLSSSPARELWMSEMA